MKNVKATFLMIPVLLLGIVAIFFSCSKEDGKLPDVTTLEVTDITNNSALSGGIINNDGGSKILAMGLVWATHENPTVSDFYTSEGQYTIDGIIAREFSSKITGLEKTTRYYARAYAANETGVGYGPVISFETDESGMIIHPLTADMIVCWTQESTEGPKENLVDGNPGTYWHSAWSANVHPLPHYIQITFPQPTLVGGFTYTHRHPSGVSGRPTKFDIQTSGDGQTWNTVWTSASNLPTAPVDEVFIQMFGQNFSSRFFRIRILETPSMSNWTYLSTISVFEFRN